MKFRVGSWAALGAAFATVASAELASGDPASGEPASLCALTPGSPLRVELVSGDALVGSFSACEGATVQFEHPRFGAVSLALSEIESVSPPEPAQSATPSTPSIEGEADASAAPQPPPVAETIDAVASGSADAVVATRTPKRALWKREMSAGIDGSMGNSENMSARLGVEGERETLRGRADAHATYQRSEDEDLVSEHRAEGAGEYEWFVPNSPWEIFGQGVVEYDELKDYDVRLSTAVGPGYRFFDTDDLRLIAQVGVGVSREFGGIDDRVTPELLAGVVFERQLSELQSIQSSLELFPDARDPGEFRLVGRAEWELLMSQRYGLAIELGIEDRYESNASPGVDENDLDYFAHLVKKF